MMGPALVGALAGVRLEALPLAELRALVCALGTRPGPASGATRRLATAATQRATAGAARGTAAGARPVRAPLPRPAPLSRGFAASAAAASAPAELDLSDVVAQVQTCAADKSTDTGELAQLAERAMARAGELSPEQIRHLCVAFAQLGYFNTQFKSIMADAVIDKLDQFDAAVLADTAWAFGEAQYYDYDLLSHLLPYLKSNLQDFDASGMAKMLWAFARFGYQDETLIDMMHDCAVKLQANCNSKALAEVLVCSAQMGWADPRLHGLVAEYAADNIQDFDAAGLAKLAYGLASVGYDDAALYGAITRAAAGALPGMSPQEVSMILWACGEQGHLCDAFMSAVVETYLPAKLAAFSPEQLQTAVKAWNRLGFSGHPAVAAAAARLSELLPHMAVDAADVAAAAK
ncbi:hypothetical protein HT031_001173 [Scenedesmus sp. PABB004]|nr:hypothetical protein HT031_001173 [Scenedesmus sp. PABB004]